MTFIYKINYSPNRQNCLKSALLKLYTFLEENTIFISSGPITHNIKEFKTLSIFQAFLEKHNIHEMTIVVTNKNEKISLLECDINEISITEDFKTISFLMTNNNYITITA